MRVILVTGMSGAGKGVALKTLEDCGFEAIDNIPLALLPAVAGSGAGNRPLALGADIRSRDFSVDHFVTAFHALKKNPSFDLKLVFLDCDDEVLARRFKTTRRRHPLAQDRPVMDGIKHERRLIFELRKIADLVIDTSETEPSELRQNIISHFARDEQRLAIDIVSFSYSYGVPREADMMFDVRFLTNPFYDPVLSAKTGLDVEVGQYVEADKDFAKFFDNMTGFLMPLLPRYLDEGKNYLTVAVGCTGGQHRSVHVAEKLGMFLRGKNYHVLVRHRDLKNKQEQA